ncbi:RteC domain-containing protein [Chryseobacterium sp.]|uniref:RteC domain-containing protein n=1 Tax=Chryseobacterium sp. TaxID=1871047 RepID=UPI0025BDFF6F|nr:RteC domain-containing protein [Chryseobacterium sp.]MBV8326702.1 RteC domain-containing protein [Chryseobacterium sp.]
MNTTAFFKKCKNLHDELEKKLELIEVEYRENRIECYEKCLMEIDVTVRETKLIVSVLDFSTAADEIHFFKEVKPLLISKFIYYSKLLTIEVAKPNAGSASLKEYYNIQLEVIKMFYKEHIDFYEYYRRKATFLDQKYFIRYQLDIKMKLETFMYNYDEKFTTSHDHLVAEILAHDLLENYLLKSIKEIEGCFLEKSSNQFPVNWSASKAGLIELIYALYHMRCFNGGNIELSEVIKFVEKSLDCDLGNFHKTVFEIRNRKQGPTKFLQMVCDNLIQHFMNHETE